MKKGAALAIALVIAGSAIAIAGAVAIAILTYHREAGAADARELVIYSPHPGEITEYIVREFRQRTGIRATVVYAGTGELIDRLKRENGKDSADVFWGGGIESLETITEHFALYSSPEDSGIRSEYKAAHGLWHPFSVLPAVILYNKSLVPAEFVPTSWSDLLNPWFRNRLIMADPAKSGSSYTILATMLLTMSDKRSEPFSGWNYVEKLIDQLGSDGLASSSSLVYRSVASGDFYAGITFENYVLSLKKTGANIGYCYPSEGTSAVPDGIALLKSARHPAEAKAFIDFVLSRDVQSILPARWQRRSVRADVAPAAQDGSDNFIDYPIRKSAESKDAILARWAALYAKARP